MQSRRHGFARDGGGFAQRGGSGHTPGGGFVEARARVYPETAGEFAALTGVTPSALYLFNEASGNVLDKVGSSDLVAAATPSFAFERQARKGILYNSAGDKHTADVNGLGVASGIYGCVFSFSASATTCGIMGRVNAGLADGLILYTQVPGSGIMGGLVRDTGANSRILTCAKDIRDAGLVLGQLQIDRAAAIARIRLSWVGGNDVSSDGSLAGFATLDGASMEFGFGALPGVGAATVSVFHGYVATGTQCEGATTLSAIARALGWE